jgi:hypothetical protein
MISLRLPSRVIYRDRSGIRLLGQKHNQGRDSASIDYLGLSRSRLIGNQRTTGSSDTRVIISLNSRVIIANISIRFAPCAGGRTSSRTWSSLRRCRGGCDGAAAGDPDPATATRNSMLSQDVSVMSSAQLGPAKSLNDPSRQPIALLAPPVITWSRVLPPLRSAYALPPRCANRPAQEAPAQSPTLGNRRKSPAPKSGAQPAPAAPTAQPDRR